MGKEAALVRISKLRHQIEAAKDWNELLDLRDQTTILATGFKAVGERIEIVNAAVEGKLLTERRLGEALSVMEKDKGAATPTRLQRATALSDLGITKIQSHRWQKLSSVPDETFHNYIDACKADKRELTTAGVFRSIQAAAKPSNGKPLDKSPGTISALLVQLSAAIKQEFSKWDRSNSAVFCDRIRALADEIEANGGFVE